MHNFTPVSALIGGVLIGLAASLFLLGIGRVAGISGILGGLIAPGSERAERGWRGAFVLGLLAIGGMAAFVAPDRLGSSPRSWPLLVAAGLLVGIGTRLGSGCTSGHGVCGISRLSPRSIVATITFIATGMIVVRVLAGMP
ncbi:MAG: YeeE/YedE family protein [Polyangiales bacterium]